MKVRRNERAICCGCVLVRYPERDAYACLKEDLERHGAVSKQASQYRSSELRAKWGTSDRLATMWGLPLVLGVIFYSQIVLGWGVYDVLCGYGGFDAYWDWEMVGQFSFGLFKVMFGVFGTFGAVLRRLGLLYLTSVCFKVFLISLGVELVVNWITALLIYTGVGHSEELLDGQSLLTRSIVGVGILLCAGITHFGMFRSFSAVVVVGGSGFERKSWVEIMLQQRQIQTSADITHVGTQGDVASLDPETDCFDSTTRRIPTVTIV